MNSISLQRVLAAATILMLLVAPIIVTAQQSIEIVGQIEVSEEYEDPQSLAWNDGSIWYSNQNTETVYQVNPGSGQVTNRIDTGFEYIRGIEATNESLWVINQNLEGTSTAREINPNTGKEISRIPLPGDTPTGIAYDGRNLWVGSYGDDGPAAFKINPQNGNVIDSIEIDGMEDLAWGAGFLWVATAGTIQQIDPSTPTGEPVQEYESQRFSPTGVTWDGSHLWETQVANRTVSRIDVGQIAQPNSPPNASFSYTPKQPSAGSQVVFDASSSKDPNGFIQTYQWDLNGDGIPDARGQQASYTFSSNGVYTVNLTLTDDDGVTGSTEKEVSVGDSQSGQQQNTGPTTAASKQVARNSPAAKPTEVPSVSAETQPNSGNQQSDERESTAENSSQAYTSSDAVGESTGTPITTNNTQQERGFFANGGESDFFSFLSNPLALTVAGFVASALGILIQLFGGR